MSFPRDAGWARLLLGAALLALVLSALPAGSGSAVPSAASTGGARAAANVTCNAVVTPTPSALLVQNPAPAKNLSPGGSIGYQMELEIYNYSPSSGPINLTFPTVFFDFPLAGGKNFSITLAARNVTISAAGWTAPTLLARTATVAAGLNFSGVRARMDSQKVAIMTSGSYGSVLLKVRWRWLETEPNLPRTYYGAWNVPTEKAHWPVQVPSEFFPAPYVRLVGTSSSPVVIGQNYTMTLTGPTVAGGWFYQELEDPADGKLLEAYPEVAPPGSSTFNVTVPMMNFAHDLTPGAYLAHVHDVCGALLYSRTVRAVFAPTVNVTFYVAPGCGKIEFNGQKYANNTTIAVVPSATAYKAHAPNCGTQKFGGFLVTGGVHADAKEYLRVSAAGTVQVRYR